MAPAGPRPHSTRSPRPNRLADSGNGYVRLINRNSNKAVEVQNAANNNGATVVQYSDWDGSNQQWQLVR